MSDDMIDSLAEQCEALEVKLTLMMTERDEAWKRAAHAEKMLGETLVKLERAQTGLGKLATAQCFGSGEILGQHLPDTPMGREILARMNFAKAINAELKGENRE